MYLFWAALALCCCLWASSSWGEQRLLSSCGAWASHGEGFSCWDAQALEQGPNLCPPHWQTDSEPLGPHGSSPSLLLSSLTRVTQATPDSKNPRQEFQGGAAGGQLHTRWLSSMIIISCDFCESGIREPLLGRFCSGSLSRLLGLHLKAHPHAAGWCWLTSGSLVSLHVGLSTVLADVYTRFLLLHSKLPYTQWIKIAPTYSLTVL